MAREYGTERIEGELPRQNRTRTVCDSCKAVTMDDIGLFHNQVGNYAGNGTLKGYCSFGESFQLDLCYKCALNIKQRIKRNY